jgi:hypothetical protein
MVEPITPKQARDNYDRFPSYVIESFNELISKNYSCGVATFKQKDVVSRIISKTHGELSESDIFSRKYLDVEYYYEEFGWNVKYEKPFWDEAFDEYFEFREKL